MTIKIDFLYDIQQGIPDDLVSKIKEEYSKMISDLGINDLGSATIVLKGSSNNFSVKISIKDSLKNTTKILINRRFVKMQGDYVLANELLEISRSFQGKGIADRVNSVGVKILEGLGGKKVFVHANLDIGGYAWLRKGFWPNNGKVELDFYFDRKSRQLKPDLVSKWRSLSEQEAKDYVLTKEFSENFKEIFLGSDWHGSADITDPKIKLVLTGQLLSPAIAKTAQKELWDSSLRLHIYELKFADNLSDKISNLLFKTENDLESKILQKLKKFNPPITSEDYKRLQELKSVLAAIRADSWEKALEIMNNDIVELVNHDQGILANEIESILPVQVSTILPGVNLIKSLVKNRPFEGKLLKEWAESMATKDIERISNAIQVGMIQGETTPQIVKRVFGTEGLKFADGVTHLSRRDIDAVVKTAISFYTNEARREFYTLNSDIIEKEQYVATLDGRTTPACRGFDGKLYAVGKGPQPPLHFRCRSLRIPQFNLASLSERPSNPASEKRLLREYAKANNLPIVKTRADLPRGTKSSFDAFSKKRKRELIGTVPANEIYQTWLKKQPLSFQEDVLGKQKAKLFNEGGLTLDKFISRQGDELTLDQLRKKYPNAFKNADLEIV